ncbi:differentially expressed in FDCP 8 homolog isoform X1 [Glossina fuscipes]|uniref:Differentially expressed in FDCP 8 homolog isoform X1 n=1 Tax=Glossina fuscipes TaxID=7396 RepID=A0A8U0W437_9MUSC|nr:differentially expressed in FDCP 8 homolog isoform X1 [Glossina fuscipes]
MNTLRESLSNLPGAVSNFISESASAASSYIYSAGSETTSTDNQTRSCSSKSGSLQSLTDIENASSSGVLISERSLPIPSTLVKEQWRLIFTSEASVQDLQEAVAHCKDLVMLSNENSEERRWLVRHLVDLRYSLKEMIDAQKDQIEITNTIKTVVGHHFVIRTRGVTRSLSLPTSRNYCDHCTGIIWSVVQASYMCSDCHYTVHQKCVDSVVRICAHVIVSERQYPIADICPEIGLAAQQYKCAECHTQLNFIQHSVVQCFGKKKYKNEHFWTEPRLCDYSGLYYCPSCHWNDQSVIPARVVHNWDFSMRRVSRASLQEINLFLNKPLIKLEEANPKLFVFLEKLVTLKKLRQNLVFMRKYLCECRQALADKLLEMEIGTRRYLIQANEFYSINDLQQTESGALTEFLYKVFNTFDNHIRNCPMCKAKAYICEICSNDEVIFPYDDGCIICDKCNSICHRVCMTRKNMICPKCVRLEERRLQRVSKMENQRHYDCIDQDNSD